MIKKQFLLSLLIVLAMCTYGQRRDIHILAVNDMHAEIEKMPRLIGIVDSLRTLYPGLLLFSAGDNRTGNPLNDKYTPSGYPMVALMNLAGFNGSAIGNHEFDANSLPRLCGLSAFRYICANIDADDTIGIKYVPYQVFDVEGMRVGVIGAIQVNKWGRPDAHPEVLRGLRFTSPFEAVSRHEWLSKQCDATILLSHVGYYEDLEIARQNPWLDVIIGGHSHRQLGENEPLHSGVLVTQNRNLLGRAVHVTLTVDSGRVVDKQAEYINVLTFPVVNPLAQAIVTALANNPYFSRVLTHAATPFKSRNEIGTMMCDALMDETGADVAIMNYRGIRISRLKAGNITVRDALEIDPYGSKVALFDIKGSELQQFIVDYGKMNIYKFPHLGGLRADLLLDKKGGNDIVDVKLKMADGSEINPTKTYRVVTNTYVVTTSSLRNAMTTVLNTTTSDVIMRYLERIDSVNYLGKGLLNYISPEK